MIREEAQRCRLQAVTKCRLHFDTALLICYDDRECWIRPHDNKKSGEIDASIVMTHMMLAAADLGVGSIWVMSWDPGKMRSSFSLDEHLVPTALLIMGYASDRDCPRPAHAASKRLEEILI